MSYDSLSHVTRACMTHKIEIANIECIRGGKKKQPSPYAKSSIWISHTDIFMSNICKRFWYVLVHFCMWRTNWNGRRRTHQKGKQPTLCSKSSSTFSGSISRINIWVAAAPLAISMTLQVILHVYLIHISIIIIHMIYICKYILYIYYIHIYTWFSHRSLGATSEYSSSFSRLTDCR